MSVRRTFWDMQAQARSETSWLRFTFAAVVIATIFITVVGARFTVEYLDPVHFDKIYGDKIPAKPDTWFAILTLGVILLGSWITGAQLSRGGQVVAHSVGGRRLIPGEATGDEKKLLNVVEEMALASGLAVPAIFVLDHEPGINAFAAGKNYSDAVVAVSKGALTELNRDELQGVVAHEFSHIFNGDMRMNMDLLSWVAGLNSISNIGRFLVETRSRKNGHILILIGGGLMMIGSFGAFMGRVVKSAISRQREFLADATALQYTRNPEGIGGALLKITKARHESIILSPFAEGVSHFFFAPAVKSHFTDFSSHPPVEERIMRIAPHMIGSLSEPVKRRVQPRAAAPPPVVPKPVLQPEALVAGIAAARAQIENLPASLADAARSSQNAPALVAAILCLQPDVDRDVLDRILDRYLPEEAFREHAAFFERSLHLMGAAQVQANRFSLISMAIPSLRLMPHERRLAFLQMARSLVAAEASGLGGQAPSVHGFSIFEGAALAVLTKALAPQTAPSAKTGLALHEAGTTISVLLSAVAICGHSDDTTAEAAFKFGQEYMMKSKISWLSSAKIRYWPQKAMDGNRVLSAIRMAQALKPDTRQALIVALEATAQHDRKLTVEESELLRAVALALDVANP